jgi:VanZ family protein
VAKFRSFLKYWLSVLLWLALIFSASADAKSFQHTSTLFEPLLRWLFPQMPQSQIEAIHYAFRKCGHLTEFAILALLCWRAIHQPVRKVFRPWRWDEAGLALALVFLCAAGDEIHQVFVPSRTAQISDVCIDTAGGAVALGLLWLGRKLFNRA